MTHFPLQVTVSFNFSSQQIKFTNSQSQMPMKGGQLKNILPYKVMILNNATTLMHKSTLSTNIFGNDHFGQKYQKQKKIKFLGDYKGV